jgi:hypothetical protein
MACAGRPSAPLRDLSEARQHRARKIRLLLNVGPVSRYLRTFRVAEPERDLVGCPGPNLTQTGRDRGASRRHSINCGLRPLAQDAIEMVFRRFAHETRDMHFLGHLCHIQKAGNEAAID